MTGASEGIGREFALQLAKKGFNVLVMARNLDKLNQLCLEIGVYESLLKMLSGADGRFSTKRDTGEDCAGACAGLGLFEARGCAVGRVLCRD